MPASSAGLLLFRRRGAQIEVLLGHPGGPFFARKDEGSWGVPKGLLEQGEDPLVAAQREFSEETGLELDPNANYFDLGEVRYKNGKRLRVWAVEGDCDPTQLESNTFELEWPPRTGRKQRFPEIDRFDLFRVGEAEAKIHAAQRPLLARLLEQLLGET